MTDKIKKLAIVITIALMIGGYFVYKLMCLNSFSKILVKLPNDNLTNIVGTLRIEKDLSERETLIFEKAQIGNFFEDFVETTSSDKSDYIGTKTNEEGKVLASVKMGSIDSLCTAFMNSTNLLGEKYSYTLESDPKIILTRNNITNDIEFLKLLSDVYKQKVNIFTSAAELDEMKDLKTAGFLNIDEFASITLIEGDYKGYILNYATFKEVRIYDTSKNYSVTFEGLDYFNDELIKQIISTLVIK